MENKLSEKEMEILRKIIKEHENIYNENSYNEDNEYIEKVKDGEKYFYISERGSIYCNFTDTIYTGEMYFEMGNYYFSKEEAEKEVEKMKIRAKLKRLAERLNFEKTGKKEITEEEWKNTGIQKHFIIYHVSDDDLLSNLHVIVKTSNIYCLDKNFLKKAIEEIGEEELKKLFK